ncbi:AAA family ATPase [Synechocystis sp. PCC 7509]|uniref:AAA family ATPase n=1 Tax=Synechocystis sp. PCC 7509 TaxID=927677 RepID=UPI0002ACF3E0|nr:AAA family ATPase [Synechocystis sp. PCC 7509]
MSYYISPSFLDKLAVHITKNFLELPGVRVPLILGIHGRKGEGKSFQCELVFERMGIEAIHMSAGELESPDAGDPGRLVRLRYREASELSKVRGKMCVLMINDLDAGAGRFDRGTQYTVNTQLVNGTLMNIADNPTDVQLPGSYDSTPLQRIPIIVTGNDFSTLYAPLIRDGRMEKFFWEPNRDDKVGIVSGIFEPDGLPKRDIEKLVDTFLNQPIDFFSALRSRIYDEQIRDFIHTTGFEKVSLRVVNSTEAAPTFAKPNFQLPRLIEYGNLMVKEQQRVENSGLVREYNQVLQDKSFPTLEMRDRQETQLPQPNKSDRLEPTPKPITEASTSNYLAYPIQPAHYNTYIAGSEKRPELTPSPAPKAISIPTLTPTPATENTAPTDNRFVYPNQIPHHNTHVDPSRHNEVLTTRIGLETLERMRTDLAQGHHIGLEFVDKRRFKTNSWQSYGSVVVGESEAIIALESCLTEHENDYVRLFGIESGTRRRLWEKIVQRPE